MNSRIINELNELVRAAELSDDEYAVIRITNLIGDLSNRTSEPCYICGNQCEVMQSMMHAYTEIHVCGDCMFEHLHPFIETVKKIESEVKRG